MVDLVKLAIAAVVWVVTSPSFWAGVVRAVLLTVATSKLFAPKLPGAFGLSALSITTRSTTEFRKIVYGQAIVSGPIVYNNTSGPDNEDLWFVIPMTEGQSEDLVEVHFDGEVIPKADIAWTAGVGSGQGSGTGNVTTARWVGDGSPGATAVRIYYYMGFDDQPANATLDTAFVDITTNFRLRGVTYMIFRLTFKKDTEDVWRLGEPRNLKAVYKGRLIYDSRQDSTNGGSGAQRFGDETTWAHTDNPSNCLSDYLIKFMGVDPATGIDWPAFATAADDCDVLVAIPPAQSPAVTEKRFTCNGALSMGSAHKDNLDSILSSMDGRLSYVGGVWTLRASVFVASSVSIVEDDLAGDVVVRGSAPRSDRFNTVRGFFVDPARDYQPSEFPIVSKAAFITRDKGNVLDFELALPMTNSDTEAQRVAFRQLEQGDNQEVADLKMNQRGAKIKVGDVVDVTVGELNYSAKTFRCIGWMRNPEGGYDVSLREDQSASYADPLVADYGIHPGGIITDPATTVPAPTGLTATSVIDGVRLNWTNPAARLLDGIEIHASDDNVRANAVIIGQTKGETFTEKLNANHRNRYYWVRTRNLRGRVSAFEPNTSGTTAVAAPLTPPESLVQDPDFDLSTALAPDTSILDEFWYKSVTVTDAGIGGSVATDVIFTSGNGRNSSNTVKIQHGDEVNPVSPPPFVRKRAALVSSRRFRANSVDFTIKIFWRNNGANPLHDLVIGVRGYAAPTGGAALVSAASKGDFATTGTTWQELTLHVSPATVDGAQFWDFVCLIDDTNDIPASEVEIDSAFVFSTDAPFGTALAGVRPPGTVPEATTPADDTKFLRGDGAWAVPAGSGANALDDLTDVTITAPVVKEFLRHDGAGQWRDVRIVPADIAFAASNVFLGRDTAGAGDGEEITASAARTILNVENGSTADQTAAEIEAIVSHDNLIDFLGAEHVDWAATGAENLATDRSANAVLALTAGEVTQLANIGGTVISATDWVAVAALVGVNTGDQTSIVGITGTKAQFDTAVTDGDIAYVGGAHHDGFSDFLAAEHVDWAVTGAEDVHANRLSSGANMADSLLDRPHISDFAVEHQAVAAIATTTIDYTAGQSVLLTMGAVNISTLNLNNWPASGRLGQLQLEIAQGATPRTITWPTEVDWINDTPPDLTAANETYVVNLTSRDFGSNIIGSYPFDSAGAVQQLSDLSDVNTSTPTNRHLLVADGVDWESRRAVAADIDFAATDRFLGRDTAGAGDGEEITPAAARTILNVENGSTADQTAGEIEAIVNHDNLVGFLSAEHVDWAATGAENLATDRSANSVLALTSGEVTQLSNIGGTVITAADWTAVAALIGVNTGDQTITLTTDVTGTGTGTFATTIAADAVTYAKMQNVAAANRVLGSLSAGGVVTELTGAQVNTLLPNFTSSLDGLAPSSGGGTDNFLRADGAWVSPPGGGASQLDELSDVTITGATVKEFLRHDGAGQFRDVRIVPADISFAATNRFLGRDTSGAGDGEEITAAAARTILNVENGSTADQTAGQIEAIVSHDNLIDFLGAEHVDWAVTGAEDIHANRLSSGANMADSLLDRPHISDFAVEHQVVTGVASTTINYSLGQSVLLNLSAANITTLTITNWPASGRLGQLEIEIDQAATARTVAWDTAISGTVEWPGGTEPDLSGANSRHLVHLRSRDGKTTLIGTFAESVS